MKTWGRTHHSTGRCAIKPRSAGDLYVSHLQPLIASDSTFSYHLAMNTMTYKGYTARVEYDERDNIFVGRILGIRNMISFHGETVAELRAEFELAVKDYLADCKQQGIHPEKPASGKLLLRVPPEVHGRALIAAQAAGKSLNQWATEALQHAAQPSG